MNAIIRQTVLAAAALLAAASATAQTYSIIKTFAGGTNDGAHPDSGLALSNGVLYGTTTFGGPSNVGTLFRVGTNGSGYTVLTNFDWYLGAAPAADLLISEGALYGVATNGGIVHNGTVFKCNLDGSGFTIIEDFASSAPVVRPRAGLLLSGNTLYGTAFLNGFSGYGSVFSVSTTGSNYTVIHSFNWNDGAWPWCALQLSGNTLYGTTQSGGTSNYGTVFKVNTDGSGFAVLKNFTGPDGAGPQAGLVLSGDTLYGTARTIFKLNTSGSGFTVLKNFVGSGSAPLARLVLSNGILYGTSQNCDGPVTDYGTVFQLNTDGSGFTVLKTFTGTDGACPHGDLLLSGRTLYGTTSVGGANNLGVVFALTLPPIPLAVQRVGNSAVLQWSDPTFILQYAPTPNGTSTNVPGAVSPYTNTITGSQQYFRLKANQ